MVSVRIVKTVLHSIYKKRWYGINNKYEDCLYVVSESLLGYHKHVPSACTDSS